MSRPSRYRDWLDIIAALKFGERRYWQNVDVWFDGLWWTQMNVGNNGHYGGAQFSRSPEAAARKATMLSRLPVTSRKGSAA